MDWMITLQCFVSSNGDMGEGGIKNGKKNLVKNESYFMDGRNIS